MLDYLELKRLLSLRTNKAQDEACKLLESRGFRFCVDFGTDNAIDKAIEILDEEWFRDS